MAVTREPGLCQFANASESVIENALFWDCTVPVTEKIRLSSQPSEHIWPAGSVRSGVWRYKKLAFSWAISGHWNLFILLLYMKWRFVDC